MKRPGRLLRLGEALPGGIGLDRLRGAWTRLVGPALAQRVRLLALRRGVLVLGCPDPALLSSLRQSAAGSWPELQVRIQRLTGLRLTSVQVEPCDPEPPPSPSPAPTDPFAEVLKRYRAHGKEPLDSPLN